MTIQELYAVCENLNHHTIFEVRTTEPNGPGKYVDEGKYSELFTKYSDKKITGFKLDDRYGRLCIVYIE
ncbi:MAG: hypothetical protein J6J12_00235 [Oscillospiraceae bacterium]|nr:hypothetical protein [Oscillospiraceae bacterium]